MFASLASPWTMHCSAPAFSRSSSARAASRRRPSHPRCGIAASSSGRVSKYQYVPCAWRPPATAASARAAPQVDAWSLASHESAAAVCSPCIEPLRPTSFVMQMVSAGARSTSSGKGTAAPALISRSAKPPPHA